MDFYTCVTRIGDQIVVRGYENGKRKTVRDVYMPVYYIPTDRTDSPFKSLDGQPLEEIVTFGPMSEVGAAFKEDQDQSVPNMYGSSNFVVNYTCEKWPGDIKVDRSLIRIGYIDIEVASDRGFPKPDEAKRPITAISLKVGDTTLTWGLKPFNNTRDDVIYFEHTRERNMLEDFLIRWSKLDLDIVTGWNIMTFDIPYLVNRIARLFDWDVAKMLSPVDVVYKRMQKTKYGKEVLTYELLGIQIIDYMEAYKKIELRKREMYTLNYISYIELDEEKLDYSEYASLNELYVKNHQKFIEYNIRDVELVERLEKKLRFLAVIMSMAYISHVNYQDVFYQTRMWEALSYRELFNHNIIFPPKRHVVKGEKYRGALVKPTVPGYYRWLVGYDLTALYPSLMIQYNISPDSILEHEDPVDFDIEDIIEGRFRNETQHIMAGNGYFFDAKKQGYMVRLVDNILKIRKGAKNKMLDHKAYINAHKELSAEQKHAIQEAIAALDAEQQTMKVMANSAYGTCGSQFYRFYTLKVAEAITMSARVTISWIISKINAYLNKVCKTKNYDFVVASDTDSIYLSLEKFVDIFCVGMTEDETLDFLEEVTRDRMAKVINDAFENLARIMGCPKNYMYMKRESISNVGFWTAKKRYALRMLVGEEGRLAEPKIKITGLEAIKTTVPEFCRDEIKETIRIILEETQDALQAHVAKVKQMFMELPVEDIATPKGVTQIDKYINENDKLIKGTTGHVKAAFAYNQAIASYGLGTKYQNINEGDKFKMVHLKQPNPLRKETIGFLYVLPKELKLDAYVDREEQFETNFSKPLEPILKLVKWKAVKKPSLMKFRAAS